MVSPEPRRRHTLLALTAYALVPGERRLRAAKHFRRAGVEVLKGVGALVIPHRSPEAAETTRREHIAIE